MAAPQRLLPLSPLGMIDATLQLYRRRVCVYMADMAPVVVVMLVALAWVSGDLPNFLFGQFYWPFGLVHLSQLIYASGGALRPDDQRLAFQQLVAFWLVQSMLAALLLPRIARDFGAALRWPQSGGIAAMLRVAPGVLVLLPIALLAGLVSVALTLVNLWVAVLALPSRSTMLAALALDTLLPPLLLLLPLALLARFAVLPQLILLEELGPRAALARCLSLTRGAGVRMLLTLLLLCLICGLLAGLPLLLPNLALLLPSGRWSGWLPWLGLLLSNCVQTLLAPLPLLATTLLYVDLRVRDGQVAPFPETIQNEQP